MKKLLQKYSPILYYKLASIRRYIKFFGRFPNIIKPQRFSDKILVSRLRYRFSDKFLSLTADKWAVRDHVERVVGSEYLSKVQLVTNSMSLVDFDDLVYPVVVKSTHGTSHVKILWSKNEIDEDSIRRLCEGWLSEHFPLWYSKIPPQIIFEEFLSVDDGSWVIPVDYKFFVFSGVVGLVVVDLDRFGKHKRSLFTRDWRHINVAYEYPKGGDLSPPPNLETMVQLAEKLSNGREFVRIDLYDLGTRVVFGEITHSPDASLVRFEPDSFDFEAGKMWKR